MAGHPNITMRQRETFLSLLDGGASIEQARALVGISRSSAWRIRKEENWKPPWLEPPAPETPAPAEPTETPITDDQSRQGMLDHLRQLELNGVIPAGVVDALAEPEPDTSAVPEQTKPAFPFAPRPPAVRADPVICDGCLHDVARIPHRPGCREEPNPEGNKIQDAQPSPGDILMLQGHPSATHTLPTEADEQEAAEVGPLPPYLRPRPDRRKRAQRAELLWTDLHGVNMSSWR